MHYKHLINLNLKASYFHVEERRQKLFYFLVQEQLFFPPDPNTHVGLVLMFRTSFDKTKEYCFVMFAQNKIGIVNINFDCSR